MSKFPIYLYNSNFHPSSLNIRIRETFYYTNLSIIRTRFLPLGFELQSNVIRIQSLFGHFAYFCEKWVFLRFVKYNILWFCTLVELCWVKKPCSWFFSGHFTPCVDLVYYINWLLGELYVVFFLDRAGFTHKESFRYDLEKCA